MHSLFILMQKCKWILTELDCYCHLPDFTPLTFV